MALGLLVAGWLAPSLAAGQAQAQAQVLILHYQERPPFSSRGPDGRPRGLLVAPLEAALARAGIAHHWARTPSQRQLALIQRGDGPDCGIGWFRTPEREALGRFSRAVYRDPPFQALVRRDSPIQGPRDIAGLTADPSLPLLVKEGYSYGTVVDGLIGSQARALVHTNAESASMARMILAGRAAWMLISPEEAQVLLANMGGAGEQLRLVPLSGVDAGPARHLYCSRMVSASVIERLDRALAER